MLDGAEEALAFLPPLLATGATTAWLVTSRVAFPEAGSQLEVGPLEPEHGAELLRRCVKSAHRREALDPDALMALSRAVDGLPLALELLGPRLRLHAPHQLVDQPWVDDRDRPARQQLVEAIRSQVAALPEGRASLLRLAAAIPGAFTASSLSRVAGEPVDAGLLDLLDAALVHPLPGAPPRFRVLAPIAAAVHDPELRQQVLDRLAPSFLAALEDEVSTDPSWPTLRASMPQLLALRGCSDPAHRLRAARLAMRLDQRAGAHQASIDRLEGLLDDGPPELRVQLVAWASDALRILGRADEALRLLERVAPLVTPGTLAEHGVAKAVAGAVAGHAGGVEAARRALEACPDADPGLWRFVGAMAFDEGRPEEAIQAFRRALTSSDPVRRAKTVASLANVLVGTDAPAAEVLELLERVDADAYPIVQAPLLNTRAWVLAGSGAIEQALTAFAHSESAGQALGQPALALSAWMHGQLVALALPRAPDAMLERLPYPASASNQPMIDTMRALAHAVRGHLDAALALEQPARESLRHQSKPTWVDLSAIFAVALAPLDPARAEAVLAELPAGAAIVGRARRAIDGQPIKPDTVDAHVMLGLCRMQQHAVRVDTDGSGFVDAGGTRVDLRRRKVLTRVLAALAAADGPLDVDAICRSAWPGERLVGTSGTRRVHVAISTLRGLGLRSVIHTVESDQGTGWELRATRV